MLATNSIDFVLVGEGPDGKPTNLESFRLVGTKMPSTGISTNHGVSPARSRAKRP